MENIRRPLAEEWPVVVFDIDGTIADIEHRRHFVQKPNRDWRSFERNIYNDKPKEAVVRLLRMLHPTNRIVLSSGRHEGQRFGTESWLQNHHIPWDNLYMRKEKDYRADNIVKLELLAQMNADGYDPWIVFDDRDQVVKMWRDAGYTCCQVAPGDF